MKLLVSVRSAEEALAALAGGADWIDLKEPSAGPLAAVDRATAEDVVRAINQRRPISAALGELHDWNGAPAQCLLDVAGIGMVKLGLAGCATGCATGSSTIDDWRRRWLEVHAAAMRADKRLVAVIYADWKTAGAPAPSDVLALAQETECSHLLIDTYDKGAGSVFCHFTSTVLGETLQHARKAGLTTVVAGSLSTAMLERIPLEHTDIVAVRGAVCREDRSGDVSEHLVRELRQALADELCP